MDFCSFNNGEHERTALSDIDCYIHDLWEGERGPFTLLWMDGALY